MIWFRCEAKSAGWRIAQWRAGLAVTVVAAAIVAAMYDTQAQDFPAHSVRIVVPFPAGGTADAMPRSFTDWLSRKWGQPVVIENRSGAGGNVGAETVAKSDPDGYTLLAAPAPPLVINQNLYPKLGFDPTEFVPVMVMGRVPNSLLVNPKLPFKSVQDVIDYARANPGKLTCATQGNGTTSHLTAEMFMMMAKVQFQLVPYRGSAPALNDLVAGNVDIQFDNLGVTVNLVQSDRLRLLGVASAKRVAILPDVPTIAETLPGFESEAWFAVVAPPKTPAPIADKINADMNEALQAPEIAQRFKLLTAEPVGGTREATAAYFRQEIERWHNVIKAAKIKLE